MSDTSESETFEDGPRSQMIFGAGQSLWLALVTVLAVLALALSTVAIAMNSGDDGGGGGGAPSVSDDLSIDAGAGEEFTFDPADVAVPADTDVSVELVNQGTLEHNWTLLGAGQSISSEADFDESMVLAQISTQVDETSQGAFTVAAGQYQVICTISGHFDAGMAGTLDAVAPAAA